MEVQIAVAKTNKYAVSESGDKLDVGERPGGGLSVVLADGQSLGRGAKAISEVPLEPGLTVVMYTDGLVHAETRRGEGMDVGVNLRRLLKDGNPAAQVIADALLAQAIRLDEGRPADDMSMVVVRVTPRGEENVRRMTVHLPLNL